MMKDNTCTEIRNNVEMSTLTSLFKHHIRNPIAVRQKQDLKFTDWKGKRKCSLFACDIVVYMFLKESQKCK